MTKVTAEDLHRIGKKFMLADPKNVGGKFLDVYGKEHPEKSAALIANMNYGYIEILTDILKIPMQEAETFIRAITEDKNFREWSKHFIRATELVDTLNVMANLAKSVLTPQKEKH